MPSQRLSRNAVRRPSLSLLQLLSVILCASTLTACAPSIVTADLPDQPANVRSAGQVTPIPVGPLNAKESTLLLSRVVRNERRQARAVRDSVRYHKELQKQYGRKK